MNNDPDFYTFLYCSDKGLELKNKIQALDWPGHEKTAMQSLRAQITALEHEYGSVFVLEVLVRFVARQSGHMEAAKDDMLRLATQKSLAQGETHA